MNQKAKIGDVIVIVNSTKSKASLQRMGIKTSIVGRKVRISQVSPHGVSFLTSTAGVPADETTEGAVELHLGISHVVNVFGFGI